MPRGVKQTKTVIATQTVRVAGQRDMVRKGATYQDDEPVVKAHPGLFVSSDEFAKLTRKPTNTQELGSRSMSARGVEQATAAPGEVRNVTIPDG